MRTSHSLRNPIPNHERALHENLSKFESSNMFQLLYPSFHSETVLSLTKICLLYSWHIFLYFLAFVSTLLFPAFGNFHLFPDSKFVHHVSIAFAFFLHCFHFHFEKADLPNSTSLTSRSITTHLHIIYFLIKTNYMRKYRNIILINTCLIILFSHELPRKDLIN